MYSLPAIALILLHSTHVHCPYTHLQKLSQLMQPIFSACVTMDDSSIQTVLPQTIFLFVVLPDCYGHIPEWLFCTRRLNHIPVSDSLYDFPVPSAGGAVYYQKQLLFLSFELLRHCKRNCLWTIEGGYINFLHFCCSFSLLFSWKIVRVLVVLTTHQRLLMLLFLQVPHNPRTSLCSNLFQNGQNLSPGSFCCWLRWRETMCVCMWSVCMYIICDSF